VEDHGQDAGRLGCWDARTHGAKSKGHRELDKDKFRAEREKRDHHAKAINTNPPHLIRVWSEIALGRALCTKIYRQISAIFTYLWASPGSQGVT
jgi:phosphoribosylaminoimidazole-succinocarboxamide synthase